MPVLIIIYVYYFVIWERNLRVFVAPFKSTHSSKRHICGGC